MIKVIHLYYIYKTKKFYLLFSLENEPKNTVMTAKETISSNETESNKGK